MRIMFKNLYSRDFSSESTVNQLADLYNTFCKALDAGEEVCAIFVILGMRSIGSDTTVL